MAEINKLLEQYQDSIAINILDCLGARRVVTPRKLSHCFYCKSIKGKTHVVV